MDDNIIQVHHSIGLVGSEDNVHHALEDCWGSLEDKGRAQYCQWPDAVQKVVLAEWMKGTCQYPLVRSSVEMNLPKYLMSSSTVGVE